MEIGYERFENVGSVLGRHPDRGYTVDQRSPTQLLFVPGEHLRCASGTGMDLKSEIE